MLTGLVLVILSLLVLVSACWVVTLRNLFRAALSLGVVLIGVAGFFILLEAEFLALVQVLVYVGAILTLVVFAIMLTAKLQAASAPSPRQPGFAAAASVGLFALLTSVTSSLAMSPRPSAEAVSVAALGQQLVTTLVLPFEVISLVFVVAMVGAIALAAPRSQASPRE